MPQAKKKVILVVQARQGSTRLPGKILMPLGGRPALWHILERVRAAKTVDQIVVATTDKPEDRMVEDFCNREKIPCYKGSEHNVLDRFYQCALPYRPEVVVRVTADCPLIVPAGIDEAVDTLKKKKLDYFLPELSKIPLGLAAEAFTFSALERAHKEARESADLEHVTYYIQRHPRKFKVLFGETKAIPRRPEFRLTVDEPADYELLKNIYDTLYKNGKLLDIRDVEKYLDSNPDIARINANVQQKKT